MKEQVENLISKLLDNSLAPGEVLPSGTTYDSTKTVSHHASKQIKDLDKTSIEVLKGIIISEKKADRRSQAYSILHSLAKKFNEDHLIYFILDRLNHEKTKSIVGLQLLGIAWSKPKLNDKLDIVLNFARRKESQIRHPAIQLLEHFTIQHDDIEDFLISVLQESKSEYDLSYTNCCIRKIGSTKSIDALKSVIRHNTKIDVLLTAITALGEIDGIHQVDFFIEMMSLKKNSFVKSALTEYITKFSDNRAVDLIIDRVKRILSRTRHINMHYSPNQKPEIVYALIYLKKYDLVDHRIPKLFKWILNKKLDFLDETELKWVTANIKIS